MKKFLMVFLILIISFTNLGLGNLIPFLKLDSAYALAPGTYTIRDILAKDTNQHPNTPAKLFAYYMDQDQPGRTGWSVTGAWCMKEGNKTRWKIANRVSTADSSSLKNYKVSDYYSQIVSKYGVEVYQAALKSGKSLKYQANSKTTPTEATYKYLPDNCKEGEFGGYYWNSDFYLTLTFTVAATPTNPGGGDPGGDDGDVCPPNDTTCCEIDCGDPPPDDEWEWEPIPKTSCGEFEVIPKLITIYAGEKAQYQAFYEDPCYGTERYEVTDIAAWGAKDPYIGRNEGKGLFTGMSAGKTTVTASIIVDNSVGRFTFQDDAELIVKEDVFSWHLTEGTLDQKSFTVDLNNPNIITVKARIKGKFIVYDLTFVMGNSKV